MIKRVSVVGIGLAAALLATAAPAVAAAGIFEYSTPGGVAETLLNPTDHACYNIDASGPATNRTNRDAVAYTGQNCEGGSVTVHPNEQNPNLTARSVRFTR
ncbi:hypothetical protein [Actinomadura decatromicini]|uniref:Uncharacterized protein n=1 Tax=Actinomadura decatromicini TaxID=2604572 RepID=A0A5D3FSS5_9ACTN|nr:hypothetical protein [Actinomadura decatromicini]TYK51159.1 hypothetical protein FXF68_12085 [Actinomadura decatromicini]